jgi:hypothetical protein
MQVENTTKLHTLFPNDFKNIQCSHCQAELVQEWLAKLGWL